MKILNFKSVLRIAYLKNTAHNIKEVKKLGFSATVVLLCIFV